MFNYTRLSLRLIVCYFVSIYKAIGIVTNGSDILTSSFVIARAKRSSIMFVMCRPIFDILSGTEWYRGTRIILRGDSFRLALRYIYCSVYLSANCTEQFILKYYHYNCVYTYIHTCIHTNIHTTNPQLCRL